MRCRAVADRSHLQSLAAAAAAAGPGSELLSVPGPLLGGALEEVEQHRLGLVAFGEQVQQLARDAAAAQQQLAASLLDSEGDLAAAMQVRQSARVCWVAGRFEARGSAQAVLVLWHLAAVAGLTLATAVQLHNRRHAKNVELA
jgi:hypothetical protein